MSFVLTGGRYIYLFNKYSKMSNFASNISRMELTILKLQRQVDTIVKTMVDLQSELAELKKEEMLLQAVKSEPITTQKRSHSTFSAQDFEQTISTLLHDKKAKYEFEMNGDYTVVYTDGACPNNGKNGARAGIGVWFGVNHPLNVGKPCPGRQTNNSAEILACAEACKVAAKHDISKLLIKTDSQFTINCVTKWMDGWKKKNWKTATGKDVINKDELLILEKEANVLQDVKYKYVSGHSGIAGNEGADQLAVKGANM